MNKGSNLNKEMFDSISKEYDFINNLITFGFHKKWKKEIVEISKKIKPKKILDLATGTADIAIELSTIENCKIIAVDPSSKMLKIGERKIQKYNTKSNIFLEEGNAENLKYSDGTFDIVTIGYGVRNFTNLNNSLNEIYRVLKKDGFNIYTVRNHTDGDFKKGTHRGEDMYEMNGFIVHYFSENKIKSLLDGFINISIENFDEGSFPRKLSLVINKKK